MTRDELQPYLDAMMPMPPGAGPPVFIYGLVDPETDEIRYIGKTVRPVERLTDHVNASPSKCHRSHWIQSLVARGLRPRMVILEAVSGAWPWQEAERYWIARCRALGARLTNTRDGGDEPQLTESGRQRIAATWLGRKHRPETLEKLRIARRARVTSAATRAKMSATQKGRVITWGAKLAESHRKLSHEQEDEVRQRLARGERVTDLARELGMHRTSISKVKMGTYRARKAEER